MTSCKDFDLFIAERASGTLAPEDARKLDFHVATCARCTAELAAFQRLFDQARLPPITDAERQALAGLSAAALADLQGAPIGKAFFRIFSLAVAAAAVVVLIANGVIIPNARRAQREAAAWTEPDVDALLAKVEKEHPELAIASDAELAHAERVADAAYLKAFGQ